MPDPLYVNFPTEHADIILLDPPWLHYGSPDKDQAAGKHYPCLSLDQLKLLPVPDLTPSLVFCWTTSSKLEDGLILLNHWGLNYRGIAFVWVKTNQSGQIIYGQGVRPSITKPTTELVLVASKQPKGRPLPLLDESIGQVVLASRGNHSDKPNEVQDRIDRMYGPTISKLELFARRLREGWSSWGNALEEGQSDPPPSTEVDSFEETFDFMSTLPQQ